MSTTPDHDALAVVVHEVRSPTAALSAIAETVRMRDHEPTARRELVRLAVAACCGIERIVSDLTSATVVRRPVDLVSVVRDAVGAAALSGASVRADVPDGEVVAQGDASRLRQVLDNLLGNACTHGSGDVVVALRTSGDTVRIAVSDDGPGVPPEDRERIFERGVRLDESRPGSGLGLAVSRAVAEAHGGRLFVDVGSSAGATIVLELPFDGP